MHPAYPKYLLQHRPPHPTAHKGFEEEFQGRDAVHVCITGQSYEAELGLYIIQGSGADIWVGFGLWLDA